MYRIQIPGCKNTFRIKVSYFNLIEFDLLGITIIAFHWEYMYVYNGYIIMILYLGINKNGHFYCFLIKYL